VIFDVTSGRIDLSGEKENEYFPDGVTEEVINALANVEGVHVVARTSAFFFKGKSVDVRQIGQALNVSTVLEGRVRREGNRLRVLAHSGLADCETATARDGHRWRPRRTSPPVRLRGSASPGDGW